MLECEVLDQYPVVVVLLLRTWKLPTSHQPSCTASNSVACSSLSIGRLTFSFFLSLLAHTNPILSNNFISIYFVAFSEIFATIPFFQMVLLVKSEVLILIIFTPPLSPYENDSSLTYIAQIIHFPYSVGIKYLKY